MLSEVAISVKALRHALDEISADTAAAKNPVGSRQAGYPPRRARLEKLALLRALDRRTISLDDFRRRKARGRIHAELNLGIFHHRELTALMRSLRGISSSEARTKLSRPTFT
jgi:hypothetical protein